MTVKDDVTEQELVVEEFGLLYLAEQENGFTRKKRGESFEYLDSQNKPVSNSLILERIKSLKIPPAWKDVWISPYSNSHLQATGYDLRHRKQYIYHSNWIKYRGETKFDKMLEFGEVLPLIRKHVEKDLERKNLDKEKVLSAVVGILDNTLIRIGNKKFEMDNRSYGLTTLRDRHMKAIGKTVVFEFSGKSGIRQELKVTDSRLAKVVKKCRDVPGYKLFQYYDEEGNRHTVTSEKVNVYLKDVTGRDITSKDFRTWGASTFALKILLHLEFPRSEKEVRHNIITAVKEVAKRLGNTEAICRKHYLHPAVLKAYADNFIFRAIKEDPTYYLKGSKLLSPEEKLFLLILLKSGK